MNSIHFVHVTIKFVSNGTYKHPSDYNNQVRLWAHRNVYKICISLHTHHKKEVSVIITSSITIFLLSLKSRLAAIYSRVYGHYRISRYPRSYFENQHYPIACWLVEVAIAGGAQSVSNRYIKNWEQIRALKLLKMTSCLITVKNNTTLFNKQSITRGK